MEKMERLVFKKRKYGFAIFGEIKNLFYTYIGMIGRIKYNEANEYYVFCPRLFQQYWDNELKQISEFIEKLNKK